jgi:S-adenosylmethionine decarboxylase
MLSNVKCEIISSAQNSHVDAYVLSESSMFVAQRRFLLKTCGTTTPLLCLGDLLKLAKCYAGFDTVEDVFYSRKNFERPDLQLKPHRSFIQEAALLDEMFADGAAYCMGSINR